MREPPWAANTGSTRAWKTLTGFARSSLGLAHGVADVDLRLGNLGGGQLHAD